MKRAIANIIFTPHYVALTVRPRKVNVAVVVDASTSIGGSDWELEQQFAINTVGAFAERDIFVNGGTASYVQFSSSVSFSGTFTSNESFVNYVNTVGRVSGGTDIEDGKCTRLKLPPVILLSGAPTLTFRSRTSLRVRRASNTLCSWNGFGCTNAFKVYKLRDRRP